MAFRAVDAVFSPKKRGRASNAGSIMYKNRTNHVAGSSSTCSVMVPRDPEWHGRRGGQGRSATCQWAPWNRDTLQAPMCTPAEGATKGQPPSVLLLLLLLIRWQLRLASDRPSLIQVCCLHCCSCVLYSLPAATGGSAPRTASSLSPPAPTAVSNQLYTRPCNLEPRHKCTLI
jgi:hypothetical protein